MENSIKRFCSVCGSALERYHKTYCSTDCMNIDFKPTYNLKNGSYCPITLSGPFENREYFKPILTYCHKTHTRTVDLVDDYMNSNVNYNRSHGKSTNRGRII